MACCAVTGQAAGIAAALSVRTGRPFHELDASLVQAELDRQGGPSPVKREGAHGAGAGPAAADHRLAVDPGHVHLSTTQVYVG